MAGRRPKPTALKALTGNPGKRPLNGREPKPRPGAPEPPECLDEEAALEWGRVAPELERLGLLTVVDGAALAGYCQAWSRAVAAERIIAARGLTVETPRGHVQARPEVSIARNAWSEVRKFAVEFGLTPSSRTRLQAPPRSEDRTDPLQEILDRGKRHREQAAKRET